MAEDRPVSEEAEQASPTESTETIAPTPPAQEPTPAAPTGGSDGIAAALSALSNAAAPVRDDDEASEPPKPEGTAVVFTPASADTEEQVPPPPPAPESAVDTYPAPSGAPVAVNVTPTAAVPPAPVAKRVKWPWIVAICIVAFLLLVGGLVSCTATVMNAAMQDMVQRSQRSFDYGDLFDRYGQDQLYDYYLGTDHKSFDDLITLFDTEEGEITADGNYSEGVYRVGENGIEPGLYYLEGSQQGVSNFCVFLDDDDDPEDPDYRVRISVEYFGNYYTELFDGDAIVFLPFSPNSTMHRATDQPMDVVPPYKSGCYRVGIDIPAGTYTITCDAEAARETESEAGAYIMSDLDFSDDSITESVYVIKGGRQTITVEAGQYLELFAAIATPATASTKVPLQPAESEFVHAA